MRAIVAGFFRRLADRVQPRSVAPSASSRITVWSPKSQPIEPLELPELGTVFVRGLLLRDRLSLLQYRNDGFGNVARLLSMTIVTEQREPVFDIEGWEAYGAKHFNAALQAWQVAQDKSLLNGDRAEADDGAEPEKKN